MQTALVTVAPDSIVEDAARLMLKHKIGGLPVLANRNLVGIVTTSDLLAAFLRVIEATEQIMNG
jgi:acetoin utilization protein AcuB